MSMAAFPPPALRATSPARGGGKKTGILPRLRGLGVFAEGREAPEGAAQ
jgi:hypothetical protein